MVHEVPVWDYNMVTVCCPKFMVHLILEVVNTEQGRMSTPFSCSRSPGCQTFHGG